MNHGLIVTVKNKMASKQAVCNLTDHTALTRGNISQKKIRKRVKSKGHLAHRSSGVPPFSAWVEPVASTETCALQDALSEEIKMKKVINTKAERLKDFQSQVQSRVRVLERMKRQEQLGKSVEAVEIVRNIVHQSSFPRVVPSRNASGLSKQDTCSFRHGKDQPIMRPITRGILAQSHEAVDKASKLLDEHAKEIRQSNKYARSALKSRAFGEEGDIKCDDNLPGGPWNPCYQSENAKALLHSENEIGGHPENSHPIEMGKEDEGDYWMGPNEIKDMTLTEPQESKKSGIEQAGIPQWLANENQNKVTIFDPSMIGRQKPYKKVTFVDQNAEYGKKRNERNRVNIQGSDKYLHKKAIEDLLKPGKVAEDCRQQQRSQMALYRKLFMDIEREQVRENIRMKEHRKRMAEIKVEKEICRLEIEHKHRQILELEEQHAKDLEQQQQQREEENKEHNKIVEQRLARLQKSKESERFVEAMKAILKEKMKLKGIRIQPLCACGPSLWDTNPDTCANNCIYYKNPKEYAIALSSLLSSLD